jgi:hypothetical protein
MAAGDHKDRVKHPVAFGLEQRSGSAGGSLGHRARYAYARWGPLFAGYVIGSMPPVILFFALGEF